VNAFDTSNDAPGVVLTGATGFLGGELLARLLERDNRTIYALVRARDDAEAEKRLRQTIVNLLGRAEPWTHRAVAIAADLTRPDMGLDGWQREWLAGRAQQIIHCAASVSFTLGLTESRRINVEGTRRMIDLARLADALGALHCLTHVSTAYVAGTLHGTFTEDDLDVGQGFRNAYEGSKLEAELALRRYGRDLPIQVMRPSIVVGDSRTGWTSSFNVLYWPLRAFASGAYPALPARRSAPVDVVPVDYVADAILALAGRPGTTYHLTASEQASSIGELVELACARFERPAPRLLPPALYRYGLHPLLARTGPSRRRKALRRSEAFFPYFNIAARYDNQRARAALQGTGIEVPPLRAYFDRLVDYALRADWGHAPLPRHRLAGVAHPPRDRHHEGRRRSRPSTGTHRVLR